MVTLEAERAWNPLNKLQQVKDNSEKFPQLIVEVVNNGTDKDLHRICVQCYGAPTSHGYDRIQEPADAC
mgnify:CR=1 FL=1